MAQTRVDILVDTVRKKYNEERAWRRRVWRYVAFKLGWGQCRYCIHLMDPLGRSIHQSTRRTFMLDEGVCDAAADYGKSELLNNSEVRKFHRCSGFTDSLFNWKGHPLESDKFKDVIARRRGAWEMFLQWGGWIVAILALIFSSKGS